MVWGELAHSPSICDVYFSLKWGFRQIDSCPGTAAERMVAEMESGHLDTGRSKVKHHFSELVQVWRLLQPGWARETKTVQIFLSVWPQITFSSIFSVHVLNIAILSKLKIWSTFKKLWHGVFSISDSIVRYIKMIRPIATLDSDMEGKMHSRHLATFQYSIQLTRCLDFLSWIFQFLLKFLAVKIV